MKTQNVDLFAIEEHVILADWLGVEPLTSGKIMPVCDECFDSGRVDGWDDYSDHFAHA